MDIAQDPLIGVGRIGPSFIPSGLSNNVELSVLTKPVPLPPRSHNFSGWYSTMDDHSKAFGLSVSRIQEYGSISNLFVSRDLNQLVIVNKINADLPETAEGLTGNNPIVNCECSRPNEIVRII